jgi:hypothetical protein
LESRQDLRHQKTLNGVFLSIEIRAEIESAIRRVDIRGGRDRSERILVFEIVEIPRVIGTIRDRDHRMTLEERGRFAPSRYRAFHRSECHRRHGCRVIRFILDRLQKSTGPFGGMGRSEWFLES